MMHVRVCGYIGVQGIREGVDIRSNNNFMVFILMCYRNYDR